MATVDTFTFVCLAANQVATHVDLQALPDEAHRAHAFSLLREHASAQTVEIWRDDAIVAVIDREGTWPRSSFLTLDGEVSRPSAEL
jgi:hypothetical protein